MAVRRFLMMLVDARRGFILITDRALPWTRLLRWGKWAEHRQACCRSLKEDVPYRLPCFNTRVINTVWGDLRSMAFLKEMHHCRGGLWGFKLSRFPVFSLLPACGFKRWVVNSLLQLPCLLPAVSTLMSWTIIQLEAQAHINLLELPWSQCLYHNNGEVANTRGFYFPWSWLRMKSPPPVAFRFDFPLNVSYNVSLGCFGESVLSLWQEEKQRQLLIL